MLIEKIKNDLFQARKQGMAIKTSLLTTLYSEAMMKGKNDGNRQPTDDECIQVIQKFIKGVEETIAVLPDPDRRMSIAIAEREILGSYLPTMATEEEIISAISDLKACGATKIGDIMKGLKEKFGSSLDGKLASTLAKKA